MTLTLHDASTERALVRCALNETALFGNTIKPGDIWTPEYRAVWQAGRDLHAAGRGIDRNSLAERLAAAGIAQPATLLADLFEVYVSPVYAESYAAKVKDWAEIRRMLDLLTVGKAEIERTIQLKDGDAPDVHIMKAWLSERFEKLRPAEPESASTPATWADMAGMIGPIPWDWPGWLPSGLLVEMVGDSGSGKSGVGLRVGKTYLTGEPWPDGTPYTGETGSVLWCEAEAAQALNLERAQAWELPCDRILSPLPNPLDDVNLLEETHRAAIAAIAARDDVRLIIVDSLSGACAGKEKAEDMMPVVKWLAELARNLAKPVLLLHHLRKRSPFDSGDVVTLDRVRGSTVIVQPARVVWAVDNPDPNDLDHKRLSVIKSNLGRFPDALGLRISDTGISFDAAPQAPKPETQLDKAIDLLRALLASGPLPSAKIEAEMKGAGISWDTAKRAKDKLGIVAHRDGRLGIWTWGLPALGQEADEQEADA